ncbi:DNA-directed RNA polymerase [Bertholletia excelsa]
MKNQERQSSEANKKCPWALKTASVDFSALWEMYDELYIRWICSNNVHTILSTLGQEAAREALIREVKHLFTGNCVQIEYRHLCLIFKFMIHTTGRRVSGEAKQVPCHFLKMSFETASKFCF